MSKLSWSDLPKHTQEAARRGEKRFGKPRAGRASATDGGASPHGSPGQPTRRAWSGAKRARGRAYQFAGMGSVTFPFDSALEAKVFERLAESLDMAHTLAVKVSYDLPAMGRREDGVCYHRFTPDFSVIDSGGKLVRVVEAKGRATQDYKLRRDAFEAEYKVKVEEVTK